MNIKPIFNLNDNDPATLIRQFQALPSTGNSGAEITYISESLDRLSLRLYLYQQIARPTKLTPAAERANTKLYGYCLRW